MVRVTVGRLYTFFPALQTLEGLGDEVADAVWRVGSDLRVRYVRFVLVPQLNRKLLSPGADIRALQ